jgi:hypothetical protein
VAVLQVLEQLQSPWLMEACDHRSGLVGVAAGRGSVAVFRFACFVAAFRDPD